MYFLKGNKSDFLAPKNGGFWELHFKAEMNLDEFIVLDENWMWVCNVTEVFLFFIKTNF